MATWLCLVPEKTGTGTTSQPFIMHCVGGRVSAVGCQEALQFDFGRLVHGIVTLLKCLGESTYESVLWVASVAKCRGLQFSAS